MARLSVVARPPGGVGVNGGAELGIGGEFGTADGAVVGACVDEIGCIALESPRAGVQVRDTVSGGSTGARSGVRGDVKSFPSLRSGVSNLFREEEDDISFFLAFLCIPLFSPLFSFFALTTHFCEVTGAGGGGATCACVREAAGVCSARPPRVVSVFFERQSVCTSSS